MNTPTFSIPSTLRFPWMSNSIMVSINIDDTEENRDIITALQTKPKPANRISFSEFWELYEEGNQGLKAASLDSFKQIYRRFVKWLETSAPVELRTTNILNVDSKVCLAYAQEVCAAKSTAARDLNVLKGIWSLVLPTGVNPWLIPVRPKIKPRKAGQASRPLTCAEVRRFRRALKARKARWIAGRGSGVLTADVLDEVYDSCVFRWYYGMRSGSIASLKKCDFVEGKDYFYHVPPKTERVKPDPLKLPLGIREVDVVVAKRKASQPDSPWMFPGIHALYAKMGKRRDESECFRQKRSASKIGQSEFVRDIKKVFAEAGVFDNTEGRASLHGFRKSFACNLAENDVPDALIKSIAGWGSNSDMLSRYARINNVDRKREAIVKFIPRLGR